MKRILPWLFVFFVMMFTLCAQQQSWIGLDFSAVPVQNASALGITETKWNGKSLSVQAYVVINCGETIENGSYELVNNDLILEFVSKKCETCSPCMRIQKITYNINNLRPGDYVLHLERIT